MKIKELHFRYSEGIKKLNKYILNILLYFLYGFQIDGILVFDDSSKFGKFSINKTFQKLAKFILEILVKNSLPWFL